MPDYLMHYGVLGMRWGHRKTRSSSTGSRKAGSKKTKPQASRADERYDMGLDAHKMMSSQNRRTRLKGAKLNKKLAETMTPEDYAENFGVSVHKVKSSNWRKSGEQELYNETGARNFEDYKKRAIASANRDIERMKRPAQRAVSSAISRVKKKKK